MLIETSKFDHSCVNCMKKGLLIIMSLNYSLLMSIIITFLNYSLLMSCIAHALPLPSVLHSDFTLADGPASSATEIPGSNTNKLDLYGHVVIGGDDSNTTWF